MPLTPSAALSRIMDSRVADARIRYAPFLNMLIARGRVKPYGKTSIDWNVRVGGEAAAIEPVTANSANTATGDVVPANLLIGRQRIIHQFSISRIAIQEAANVAPGELKNLYGAQIADAMDVIGRRLNNLLFAGTGTAADAEVFGLNWILDNTKVYAGIDPTTTPAWRAVLQTNATPRPLTRVIVRNFEKLLANAQETYDFVVMSPNQAEAYGNTFDTVAGAGVYGAIPTNPQGLKNADLGIGDVTFGGRPVIVDPACPDGQIVAVDTSQLDLFIYDVPTTVGGNADEADQAVNNSYGLPIVIADMPSANPDFKTFSLRLHPQLRVFNRKAAKGIMNLNQS